MRLEVHAKVIVITQNTPLRCSYILAIQDKWLWTLVAAQLLGQEGVHLRPCHQGGSWASHLVHVPTVPLPRPISGLSRVLWRGRWQQDDILMPNLCFSDSSLVSTCTCIAEASIRANMYTELRLPLWVSLLKMWPSNRPVSSQTGWRSKDFLHRNAFSPNKPTPVFSPYHPHSLNLPQWSLCKKKLDHCKHAPIQQEWTTATNRSKKRDEPRFW